MTRDLEAGVAALGARFDDTVLAETRALYAGCHQIASGIRECRDLRYGPHDRHRADVFTLGAGNAPVLLFVHGGGFVSGDKASSGDFYANVGRHFAARGYVAATMNYRLAPAHPWPAGRDDVAAAVEWLAAHAGEYGGDGRRIVLLGQSAGACHVSGYLFDPPTASRARASVRAAALLSGFYAARAPLSAGQAAYFGTDAAVYAERSPATHVSGNDMPVMLSMAEFDPGRLAAQTLELAGALTTARGACPQLNWFRGHNHVSTVMSLGTRQAEVGDALEAFFDRHLGTAA